MAILLMFLIFLAVVDLNINKNITGQTRNDGTKDVQIMVPLQYLRTIEMQLINCEIIIVLAWSENCIIVT